MKKRSLKVDDDGSHDLEKKKVNRETIRAAFQAFDDDGSGTIDVTEFHELVKSLEGVLTPDQFQDALKLLDKDGNGVISFEEFEAWWMQQSEDVDGDGQVNELEKVLSRLKELGQERFHVDIHTACWSGHLDVVERLLENDVVNERDSTEFGDMNSPLHYAAYKGNLPLCKLLINNKAKVNATNASGCTPLFFASQQEKEEVVKYLLEQGADAKLREAEHQFSPVDVASSIQILEIFKSIRGDKPSLPQRLEAADIKPTSITITWAEAAAKINQALPISGFKIKVTQYGAKPMIKLTGSYPLNFKLEKLKPGIEYSIQISAVSLHGASDYCDPLVVNTINASQQTPRTSSRSSRLAQNETRLSKSNCSTPQKDDVAITHEEDISTLENVEQEEDK
ncbi:hypothetical protein THRCLA_20363 [Thraustotheca clavata]|uniref:Uncharacterized protein n=1 Tax=Thraustotheca clavata TaxID=74557 RepID=A0A1W0A871_9STRA|nr:hypothetical protein THRCLA_20363 [Thraustotheca clavata]